MSDALAEMVRFLNVVPTDDDAWIGEPPEWFGTHVFGGFAIAQAIMAATRGAPAGTRMHSLHAYFLRPATTTASITYRTEQLRSGRTFTAHHVSATQDGKATLDMSCSFTADTDGYVYDLPPANPVLPPADYTAEPGPGPWLAARVGPSPVHADGTRESTYRTWFRVPDRVPSDDPHMHTALLGFATDWTGTGGRPLQLDDHPYGMVSLDHAVWFHRPARVDDWLLYDVQSLVNAGGRGLLRGVIRDQQGFVVASVAQELRLDVV